MWRTRISTLEDSVLCAMNVGKHSNTNPHLLLTREPTPVTSFMCVVNVENPLGKAQLSVNIEEFILGQGSTSVVNVENALTKNLSSFILGEVTLVKIVMCAMNVHSLLVTTLSLFDNIHFTLEN